MRVLVYQSHAPQVPRWVLRCTASVRAWADRNGYFYRLLGDELFQGIPMDISVKAQSMLPLADMGRLLWAERLLSDWDCVVWIDADVLVFAPEQFVLDLQKPYLVCREVLVRRTRDSSTPTVLTAYNPTVLMFRDRMSLLTRWLRGMKDRAARQTGLGDADFGRALLERLLPAKDVLAINSVGHFNAAILKEIYGRPGAGITLMMQASRNPYAAANLCGHHQLPTVAYQKVIDRLLETAGEVVNCQLTPPPGL